MSDTATDLTPPVEDPTPPVIEEQAAPDTPAEEDQLEPEIASQGIEIPGGEPVFSMSVVKGIRNDLKAARVAAAKATELEQQIQQLQGQLQQSDPIIQAARALLESQRQQQQEPPAPQGPTPQEIAALEEYARDLDLYDKDGRPDVARAHRIKQRTLADAQAISQQAVQPLVEQQLTQQAHYMLTRAKATATPSGEKPDPAILDQVVARIANQPGGAKMLAQEQYMTQLWYHALGLTRAMQSGAPAPKAPAAQEALPPPVFSEKSGGGGPTGYSLNAGDKKLAKDLGVSEAEFAKTAASMPWGKR
jgi:hypothetical protein